MKLIDAFGGLSLMVLGNGLVTILAQSVVTTTTSITPTKTSKSFDISWTNAMIHTPSTFTTTSLMHMGYASFTTSTTILLDSEDTNNAARNYHISVIDDQVMQEDSHESLTITRIYGTITVTLTEASTTHNATYTGPVDVESMVTLDIGTHTTTEAVVITVTESLEDSATAAGTLSNTDSTSAYDSLLVNTQPGLTSFMPTIVVSSADILSSASAAVQSTTVARGTTNTSLITTTGSSTESGSHSHTSVSSSTSANSANATESVHSNTDSSAATELINIKKTMGVLAALTGVMVIAL